MGIEDDNPTVAGKGIEHLRQHGIKIHMFDRDLQDVILKENKTFFEWARQQPEKPEPKPIKLSKYEDPVDAVLFKDLSEKALEHYRSRAKLTASVGSEEFTRLLRQQGLLVESGGVLTPTGFGFLLFGNEPRNAIPQAGVLANAKLSDDKSSRKEFGQAMVLIPGLLEEWLNMVLPSTLDRSRMERMEQMRSFSAPMKSRNPVLHYVFARMGLAEEQGFGLTSLKMHAEKLGLPLPSYSMEGDFLVLTIYRSKAAASLALGQNVLEKLSKAERVGWEWLATKEKTNSSEYAESLKLPYRTAMNHLKKFQNLGLLEKSGSGRATEYTIHPR